MGRSLLTLNSVICRRLLKHVDAHFVLCFMFLSIHNISLSKHVEVKRKIKFKPSIDLESVSLENLGFCVAVYGRGGR